MADHCPTCGTPVITQDGAFLPLPPLRVARIYAEADLSKQASATQLRWLHDHAHLWLRALIRIKRDVETHIAKSHRDLAPLKPPSGTGPTPEYLAAKATHDQRTTRRLHFISILDNQMEAVATLVGSGRLVESLCVGDMVRTLTLISEMAAQDDSAGAHDVAEAWIRILTQATTTNDKQRRAA